MVERTPVGACEVCGYVAFEVAQINQVCPSCRQRQGARRAGVIGSRLNVGDWRSCEACIGSGRIGADRCSHCDGAGWIDARDSIGRPR